LHKFFTYVHSTYSVRLSGNDSQQVAITFCFTLALQAHYPVKQKSTVS